MRVIPELFIEIVEDGNVFHFLKARERGVFRDWLQIRRGASGDSGDSASTNTAASSAHHGQDEPLAVPHVPQDPRALSGSPKIGIVRFHSSST